MNVIRLAYDTGPSITIRGKTRRFTPYLARYAAGQRKEHSVFSETGHVWIKAKHGQTRHCIKCQLIQCSPPKWVPIPFEQLCESDVKELIKYNG